MFKKLFLIAIIFALTSCLDDDNENLGITQLGSFTEISSPSDASSNEEVTFNVKIKRPYECLKFEQFEIDKSNDNYVLIKPILVEDYRDCNLEEQNELIEDSLKYTIDREGEMKFRFLADKKDDGTYNFIEKIINVTDE
ncbi:MAG: hypothetical protein ACTHYV_00460 [Psychroflexus sp.]|uniref:hypothetical protein n=1 Tax=Psychroflexus sp. S27 TaxID=1982757 RepID=UPI000C2989FF|nr:hypothetical protein [Psychroflexus sp. S27]PJX27528.1 hypothetical protein CAP47_01465 [Psychroflexus sp. S27]